MRWRQVSYQRGHFYVYGTYPAKWIRQPHGVTRELA